MTWLLLSCTWPEPEPADTSAGGDSDSACRVAGHSPSDPAAVSVLEWTLDGLPLFATPVGYCSSEGQLDFELELEDDTAWVTITADEGAYNFPGADARVDVLYGAMSWSEDDFFAGALSLDDEGGSIRAEANGADASLTLELAWTASP